MTVGEESKLSLLAILLEGAVLIEGDLDGFHKRSVQCHGTSNVSPKTSILNSFIAIISSALIF